MIVNSSLQNSPAPSFARLNSTSRLHIIPNMTLTSPGSLIKWTFAAKFNHNGRDNKWPEMQIWRRVNEAEMRYRKVAGTSMEPRHTGYLNVFEYNLVENPIKVESGDVLGIYEPNSEAQYSLEFLADSEISTTAAKTNYIMYGVNRLRVKEYNITDKHVERLLVPMVFAHIQGTSQRALLMQYNFVAVYRI